MMDPTIQICEDLLQMCVCVVCKRCREVWYGLVWCVNATISNTSSVKVIVDGEQERCCQEAVCDQGR